MSRQFAVFDIDGTVIRWQLYHAVVSKLAKEGKLSEDAYETIQAARMNWKQRTHDESFREYEHTLVKVYFAALQNLKVSDYLAVVDTIFDEYKDQVYNYTRDLIRDLKAQNYLLLAISGSQHEIITKLASYYGFDEAKGTLYEQKNGYFTGQESTPLGSKDKILHEMLANYDVTFGGSIAVGDSEGDIKLLEQVEQPIVFNPSRKLFTHAQKANWKVVVERKNMIYELEPNHGQYLLAQTNG